MTSFNTPATAGYAEPGPCASVESDDALRWLREGQRADLLSVRRVPLHQLKDWVFEPATGNLRHRTGRFFSIHGVRVDTTYGTSRRWTQPVIAQPEVGILGFLATRRAGELCFLVQRKIEPGNVNIAQASPTVQATRSNYTRVHGGGSPPYLDYFLSPPAGSVVVDQLQQEQASRYHGKRNRNMIVEIDDTRVDVLPGYRWMSRRELAALTQVRNAVNLDTRSVLSCLPADAQEADRDRSLFEARRWLTRLGREYDMHVQDAPLRALEGWRYDDEILAHQSGRYFEVIGVSVEAPTREVPRWDQPLVRSVARGVVGLICQQRDGVRRFLMRGVLEPGEPHMRIGPTVQCVPSNHDSPPAFLETVMNAPDTRVRFRSVQSEEGGRFYHDERLLVVVEAAEGEPVDVPPGFCWLTPGDLAHLSASGAHVNIEARSLLACLALTS